MRKWLVAAGAVLLCMAAVAPQAFAATVPLGSSTVYSQVDSNTNGQSEAFPATANASGTVDTLHVYLDGASNAPKVCVGVYANVNSKPGALLVQGCTTTPHAGQWNALTVASTAITQGTHYWLALLGIGSSGQIQFRDQQSGQTSYSSTATGLTTLPATYSTGASWPGSGLSVYADATAPAPTPTPPLATPTTTPAPPTPTPSPPTPTPTSVVPTPTPTSPPPTPTPAQGIRLVHSAVNGNEASSGSLSVSTGNVQGDFLVVTGTAARPASTLIIADTLGNAYSVAAGPFTDTAQDATVYVWYVPVCKGGTDTVTITPPSAAALEIHVSEWSGIAAASSVDQAAFATGTGTAVSSGLRTTTTGGELIFGYGWVQGTASAGSGFTPISLVNGDLDEYLIQATAGGTAATFTQDSSGTWFALMITFRPQP